MVMQTKTPKTSSGVRTLLNQLEQARSPQDALAILLSEQREAVIRDLLEWHMYKSRRKLLLELANLHDAGLTRFWRMWGRRFSHVRVPDQELLKLRNELRDIWEPQTPATRKQRIIEGWLEWNPPGLAGLGYRKWVPVLAAGRLVPAFKSLPSQLVQGVLEQARKFRICRNPKCPARYFLARRKDQKYCERGPCTAYGQTQRALQWWNEEGKKRREQKQQQQRSKKSKKAKERKRR